MSDFECPELTVASDISPCLQSLIFIIISGAFALIMLIKWILLLKRDALDIHQPYVRRWTRFIVTLCIFITHIWLLVTYKYEFSLIAEAVQSGAWFLSILLIMTHNYKKIRYTSILKWFFIFGWLMAAKSAESELLIRINSYVTDMDRDIGTYVLFFFTSILLYYAITINGRTQREQFSRLYGDINNAEDDEDILESPFSSPETDANREHNVWTRFVNSSGNQNKLPLLTNMDANDMIEEGAPSFLTPAARAVGECTIEIPTFMESMIRDRQVIQFEIKVHLSDRSYSLQKKFIEFKNLQEILDGIAQKYHIEPIHLNRNRYERKEYQLCAEALELFIRNCLKQVLYWSELGSFLRVNERITKTKQRGPKPPVVSKVQTSSSSSSSTNEENNKKSGKYNIINVCVTGWSRWATDNDNNEDYFTFQIIVQTDNAGRWVVDKKLDQVEAFRLILCDTYKDVDVPTLTLMTNYSTTEERLKEHKSALEMFLQKLVNVTQLNGPELKIFLSEQPKEQEQSNNNTITNDDHIITIDPDTHRKEEKQQTVGTTTTTSLPSSSSGVRVETKLQPQKNAAPFHRFNVSIKEFEYDNEVVYFTIIMREFFNVNSYLEWIVKRRYSEFELFRTKLKEKFTGSDFPSLPEKSFFRNNDPEFLEIRRKGLEIFLQNIINTSAFQTDEYNVFFHLSNPDRVITVGTIE